MRGIPLIVLALFFAPLSFGHVNAQTGDGSDRETPLTFGDTIEVGDYSITVVSVNFDAEEVILAENSLNEPAASGHVFVLVTVSVAYVGNETGDPGWELNFKTVGNQNRGYLQSDMDCGVTPNDEFSAGELFPEGEAAYNLCWQVTEDEAPTLIMYAEPLFSADEARVYFSLDDTGSVDSPMLEEGSLTFAVEIHMRGLYLELDEGAQTCSGTGFYRVVDAGSEFTIIDGNSHELLYATVLSAGVPQASSCAWSIAVLGLPPRSTYEFFVGQKRVGSADLGDIQTGDTLVLDKEK